MGEHTGPTEMDELDGKPLTGVGVAARVTLAAHALNNEGSRNNAMIPRQVDVVQGDAVVQTNAISGDSLKHTYVDHLRRLASAAPGEGLALCAACARGDPNRANAVKAFQDLARTKNVDNAQVIAALLEGCVIDDVAGLLVTQGNRNAPRRSTVQFGWELGIPDRVRTGRYMHLKLVPGAPDAESEEGSNLGQNLFTRPASSGAYALVAQLDLARIGVSDITWQPVLPEATRRARQAAALEALYWTVAVPEGAQRNTQLPHLVEVAGAVSVATGSLPPVLVSPLADGYVAEMTAIAERFGHRGRDLFVLPFGSVGELGSILETLAGQLRPPEPAHAG